MSKAQPFVFNDETVYNSYGFRTANAGINLDRFKANPVMLNGHWASNENVIGRWENFDFDGTTLSGLPVFDTEDEAAKKIAGKVERGFLKGCSMGLLFNREDMVLEPNGKWMLSKSELIEVSIVAIPANEMSLRLYVQKDGVLELMEDADIKLCLSALKTETNFENKNDQKNMKKVMLSTLALVALGLENIANPSEGVDANLVEQAIDGLKSKLSNSEVKLSAAEAALKAFKDAEIANLAAEVKTFVDSVVPSKYDETDRETVTKLATTDLAFAKKLAATLPAKSNLAGGVSNTETKKEGAVTTMEDFQKMDTVAQLAFKKDNPEAYNKIIAEA